MPFLWLMGLFSLRDTLGGNNQTAPGVLAAHVACGAHAAQLPPSHCPASPSRTVRTQRAAPPTPRLHDLDRRPLTSPQPRDCSFSLTPSCLS